MCHNLNTFALIANASCLTELRLKGKLILKSMATIDDIRMGECEVLEFKQELPQKDRQLLKTVVAFANGYQGGRILFGVQDDGTICGVEVDSIANLKDNLINMISEACTPQIYMDLSIERIADKTVLVAHVPHGRATPYYIKKEGIQHGTYVRIGATTRTAEQEKLEELILEGSNKSYDSVVDREARPVSPQEILDLATQIHEYLGDAAKRITAEQMIGWKLLRRDGDKYMPTVAFRLLTYNDIYFARVQCGAFKGNTTDIFLDKKEFEGSVCEQLEQAQSFILRHINIGAEVNDLRRTNIYEIPLKAIREALANAILHRNYLQHAHIRVAVFDDRVEIFSPGTLYGITKQQMLNGCSSLRNPILADVFLKMDIVEKWGSGIHRICSACKQAGIPSPRFETSEAGVTVIFTRTHVVVTGNPRPRNQHLLTARQQAVLHFLSLHPSATYDIIGAELGVSRSSVRNVILGLKDAGFIIREGSDKKGAWKILKKSTSLHN